MSDSVKPAFLCHVRRRIAMVATVVLALTACAGEVRQPGAAFRDCVDCPEMVALPVNAAVPARPVALGRHEVTQRQFATFIADTGYRVPGGCELWRDGRWQRTDDADWTSPGTGRVPFEDEPVVCIAWQDADAYVRWLAARLGLPYRLPTDAEWAHAVRAGTIPCARREPAATEAPIGAGEPNPPDQHDRGGSLAEWTAGCGRDSPELRVSAIGFRIARDL